MKYTIYLFTAVLFISCAQKESPKNVEERQLGTIATELNSKKKAILKENGIAFEKLSGNQNLYHIKGQSKEDLKKLLGDENLIQNFYLKNPEEPNLEEQKENLLEDLSSMVEPQNTSMPTCLPNVRKPLAVLNTENVSYRLRMILDQKDHSILDLDARLSLNADKAQIERMKQQGGSLSFGVDKEQLDDFVIQNRLRMFGEKQEDIQLDYYWMIETDLGRKVKKGADQVLSLNLVGTYKVFLIVQDKLSKGCSVDALITKVTANPEPIEDYALPELKEDKVSEFVHLDKNQALYVRGLNEGSQAKIAVMDSGVNYNHPSIRPNIMVNEGEIPNNGIDDDNNGYIDDRVGYDFENSDGYAFDDGGHGSHVAGIAAGADIGIAPKAKILPIKMSSFKGFLEGMQYAAKQDVDVINMSFHFPGKISEQARNLTLQVFEALNLQGIVVAVASGNDQLNIDGKNGIPTNMTTENVIVVSALNEFDSLTSYSNFGLEVDIATHGGSRTQLVQSVSLYDSIGLPFVGKAGTSMATPVVAGSVALVRSLAPHMSAKGVIDRILATSVKNPNLEGKISDKRQLNLVNLVSGLGHPLFQP